MRVGDGLWREKLTVYVEFPQRVNDGEEPVSGKCSQREHGHADRHVLRELRQGA